MAETAPLWMLADAADAKRLRAAKAEGPALGLTPAARAALVGSGRTEIDPRGRFTDWAQARTVVAVRRATAKLIAAVAELPEARPIHREIALDHFRRAAYTGYRLWFTLGADGPWMVAEGEGWRRCEMRDEAYRALLARMLVPLVAGQAAAAAAQSPPWPGLYRRLRRFVLRRACRGRAVFVSGARKGMFGLLDALVAAPAPVRILVVQSATGGWREYARLARSAWRARKGDAFLDAALLAVPQGSAAAAAERLLAAVDDPVIAAAFAHYRGLLAYRLAQVEPALADTSAIVAAAEPRHYLSPEISRMSDWALAEICGETGATRWVMSRNTHVAAPSRLAEDGCAGYFFTRHPAGLVDRYLFWSPHGALAARSLLPRSAWPLIEPVAAVAVPPPAAAGGDRTRRILVADTFASLWFPHSWVFQTSDEYAASLAALCGAAADLGDVEILVRAKARRELDEGDYARLLPPMPNLRIKIRDVPFGEDLAACDLLVAFRSTTIEEALHARRAVLLWGASARYRYLPARSAPPRAGDRGAVYAADTEADLARLLPAILDRHAGAPLSDAEIAAHVWPRGTPDIGALAQRLLGAAPRAARRAA